LVVVQYSIFLGSAMSNEQRPMNSDKFFSAPGHGQARNPGDRDANNPAIGLAREAVHGDCKFTPMATNLG